uniref:Uncharacterized protein n=1 Tax=Myotis myotis TaxID=51298 RepID=A0A7J8AMH0_MYOMY|nr:hypothetical protein mMyoMyo1_008181 [Myotis myotis]
MAASWEPKARETPNSLSFQQLSQDKHFLSTPISRGTSSNPEEMLMDSTDREMSISPRDQTPRESPLSYFPLSHLGPASASPAPPHPLHFILGKWQPLPLPPQVLSCNIYNRCVSSLKTTAWEKQRRVISQHSGNLSTGKDNHLLAS